MGKKNEPQEESYHMKVLKGAAMWIAIGAIVYGGVMLCAKYPEAHAVVQASGDFLADAAGKYLTVSPPE